MNKKKLKEHSLSIFLLSLMAITGIGSWITGAELRDVLSNLLGDSYGAFIIVVLTKWFRERGSAESK